MLWSSSNLSRTNSDSLLASWGGIFTTKILKSQHLIRAVRVRFQMQHTITSEMYNNSPSNFVQQSRWHDYLCMWRCHSLALGSNIRENRRGRVTALRVTAVPITVSTCTKLPLHALTRYARVTWNLGGFRFESRTKLQQAKSIKEHWRKQIEKNENEKISLCYRAATWTVAEEQSYSMLYSFYIWLKDTIFIMWRIKVTTTIFFRKRGSNRLTTSVPL